HCGQDSIRQRWREHGKPALRSNLASGVSHFAVAAAENGFVSLFFLAHRANASMPSRQASAAGQRDPIHCLPCLLNCILGSFFGLYSGEMWAALWLEDRPPMPENGFVSVRLYARPWV